MKPLIFLSGDKNKTQNYRKAFSKAGFSIADSFAVADALCLCGGGDISPCFYGQPNFNCRDIDFQRDGREFFYLRKFLDKSKPVIAICRGLQLANVYFGGTLNQNVYGHSQINGADTYHAVDLYGYLKELYGEHCIINSAHHQTIDKLGNGLKITAISPDGTIEGFCGKNVLACQFHPERLNRGGIDGDKIFHHFYKSYFA